MSYMVPVEDVALQAQEGLRRAAITAGKNLAIQKSIASSQAELIERPADYLADYIPAGPIVNLYGWQTMPLAAIAGNYSVFANSTPAAVTPTVPDNAVWVFYGVELLDPNPQVSYLLFTIGPAGNRTAQFDLEQLMAANRTEGYFTKPVVYGPHDIVGCTVRAISATGLPARVVLKNFVIEPGDVNLT